MTTITGEIIIPLAGLQYYKLDRCAGAIMQGTRLKLTRQPDNPYDPNAILVELDAPSLILSEMPLPDGMGEWDRWPLGHIPASTTSENWARLLSAGLDDGLDAECFYHEGQKRGAWSMWVRVSGPAVERAQQVLEDRYAIQRQAAGVDDLDEIPF